MTAERRTLKISTFVKERFPLLGTGRKWRFRRMHIALRRRFGDHTRACCNYTLSLLFSIVTKTDDTDYRPEIGEQ